MIETPRTDPTKGNEILPWAKEVQKYIKQDNQARIASPSRANRNTYRNRYHFKIEAGGVSSIIVRAGSWTVVDGSTRTTVDMGTTVGASPNSENYAELNIPSSGVGYVILTIDDPVTPATLIASIVTDPPESTDMTIIQIGRVSATAGEFDDIPIQDWFGGNIITDASAQNIDDLSLDRDGANNALE